MTKDNQRIIITKKLLRDALIKLLQKKHIDDISVSKLCQEAQINRTTFYRHYQTPHDVLIETELELIKIFYKSSSCSGKTDDIQSVVANICRHLYSNKKIVKIFMRNNTDKDISLIFRNFSEGFLASREAFYKGEKIDASVFSLMQTFFSQGLYASVRQWILEDIPLVPEQVADLIVGIINQNFSFK